MSDLTHVSRDYDPADNSAKSYDLAIKTMREKLESFPKKVIGDCVLYQGDCLELMPLLPQVDAVVTDPPYHLTSIVKRFGKEESAPAKSGKTGAYARASKGFMGKEWDGGDVAFCHETWAMCCDLLKAGGHIAAFSGSRTYHRMACALEDGGFECRDQLMWLYGSGFPKSHDVSKGIDKASGVEREKTPTVPMQRKRDVGEISSNKRCGQCGKPRASSNPCTCARLENQAVTPEAQEWQGWGTALKPAHEPIFLGRKPISESNIAANVLRHGTGAVNIDGCRVEGEPSRQSLSGGMARKASPVFGQIAQTDVQDFVTDQGRWPANLIHDGSVEVAECFPIDSRPSIRFFYSPKASSEERNRGCEKIDGRFAPTMGNGIGGKEHDPETATRKKNFHPTVKPINLMAWLARLITQPNGLVLDPFMGSGTTGVACVAEGFKFVGIERDKEYFDIACKRIEDAYKQPDLFVEPPKEKEEQLAMEIDAPC